MMPGAESAIEAEPEATEEIIVEVDDIEPEPETKPEREAIVDVVLPDEGVTLLVECEPWADSTR